MGETLKTDLVKRAALLGGIAWASLCLLTVGLSPSLQTQLSNLWITSGLLGLASALGLIQVVKRDSDARKAELTAASNPQSRLDSLTGLPNRWEFDRLINIMIADAQDHQLPLSLLLIDVDQMQQINQREGYMGGDDILCKLTKSIIKTVRGADLVCRYDDDEFAVVLADLDKRSCESVLDRLRGQLQECVSIEGGVTVSLGASTLSATDSASCLVRRAQLALFRSKSDGKDRGCYHDGDQLMDVNPARQHATA